MSNTEINFDEIIELMIENNSLMKVMQGYCMVFSEDIDEMNNLISIFETVIENHNKIWSKLDLIEGDILRQAYPEIFK